MSYDASIALAQLPPILGKAEERCITTLIRYQNHFDREIVTNGHMACAFEIATRHNITPNLYETHAKTISSTPLRDKCQIQHQE